ncbi:metal-dependent hydrolase [Saliphagus sp. LR7]|uniref:metal-dependent hydrolase n=1 Tax=Saliphagus sp. LR7 TaxID=2282654 RepID=UPI000DF76455|nr:metal-dependent hydrolase [Saliphagus sp. LR7]
MFVGHALLAFALAALAAEWRGWARHRVVALGILAGAFAAIPDVDVVYAVFAMDPAHLVAGSTVRPSAFWGAVDGVHRSMTHSLIVAAVAGPAFGLWARPQTPDRSRTAVRALSLGPLGALVAVAAALEGPAGGAVMAAFAAAGLGVATLARRHADLSPRVVGLVATAGLASHPWGDFLTGQPPALLYPLDADLATERVVLAGDPTLHLLATFALELTVVALAVAVVAHLAGRSPRGLIDRRATLGAGYGAIALVLAPPTIHVAYPFVLSILAVGVVCGLSRPPVALRTEAWRRLEDPSRTLETVSTGLAGVALALGSYAAVYLLAG